MSVSTICDNRVQRYQVGVFGCGLVAFRIANCSEFHTPCGTEIRSCMCMLAMKCGVFKCVCSHIFVCKVQNMIVVYITIYVCVRV